MNRKKSDGFNRKLCPHIITFSNFRDKNETASTMVYMLNAIGTCLALNRFRSSNNRVVNFKVQWKKGHFHLNIFITISLKHKKRMFSKY